MTWIQTELQSVNYRATKLLCMCWWIHYIWHFNYFTFIMVIKDTWFIYISLLRGFMVFLLYVFLLSLSPCTNSFISDILIVFHLLWILCFMVVINLLLFTHIFCFQFFLYTLRLVLSLLAWLSLVSLCMFYWTCSLQIFYWVT